MGDDASQRSLGEELRQLRAIVERLVGEREERQARISEILASAGQQPSFSQRKPKRDRHGMHIVRGLAPLGAVGAWLGRSRPRRVTAAVAAMTLATGATLTPDVIAQAPASQVPRHHHARVDRDRHRQAAAPAMAPVVPPRRKRRRPDTDDAATRRASPSPFPSPSAPPAPSPEPSPLPSVPPPSPSPDPTCTLAPHGKHCHGGEVVVQSQGLAGPYRATMVNRAPLEAVAGGQPGVRVPGALPGQFPGVDADHVLGPPAGDPHQVVLGAAGLEPVVGEGAPEPVRVHAGHPGRGGAAGEHLPDPPYGEPAPRPGPQPPARGLRVADPGAQVPVDRGDRLAAERHGSLVAAFEPDDGDLLAEVDV